MLKMNFECLSSATRVCQLDNIVSCILTKQMLEV